MTPTGGEAATQPDPERARLLSVTMEELAEHDGDYQVRRLRDHELLERTPDLELAVRVADAEPVGAYIDYVRPCPGDPLGLGLSVRQRTNVVAGAGLFADRTMPARMRISEGKPPITDGMNLPALYVMFFDLAAEEIGIPRAQAQESIYREACRMGRES